MQQSDKFVSNSIVEKIEKECVFIWCMYACEWERERLEMKKIIQREWENGRKSHKGQKFVVFF